MQIDVGAVIAELLFEHQTVSIPGLGAFEKSTKSASVDQIQGKANVDSSLISFNSNLAIDDGLLIGHLKEKFKLTYQEAKQTIAQYVQEIKAALDKKEIIVVPDVGRIYSDFENKIQFIPDATNFNLDTFGLPEVSIAPVPPTVSTTSGETKQPLVTVQRDNRNLWIRRNWPILAAVLGFLVILLGFFFLYPKYFKKQQPDPTANLPSARLNVKPPPSTAKDSAMAELEETSAEQDIEENMEEEDVPSEEPTLAPNTKVCVIAVGIFREKTNVDRLSQRIIEAGYEPYLENLGSKTRVGIQFAYANELDISKTLEKVRDQFVKEAFVLKK